MRRTEEGTALLVTRSMSGKAGEVRARVEGKGREAKMRSQGLEMLQQQAEVEVEVQVVRGQTELPSSKPGWQSWQGTMRMKSGELFMLDLWRGGPQSRSLQITLRNLGRLND